MCPALTFQQRIIGCLSCLVIGFFLSMGSTFRLIKLLEGDPEPFAIMYTIGNVIGLLSTCFLYGPVSQMKQMFAPTRWETRFAVYVGDHRRQSQRLHMVDIVICFAWRLLATGIYLFFMALTLFLAFYKGDIPVRILWLVLSIFCQFLALIWYTLSYIPFAREIAANLCQQTCCKGMCASQVGACLCDIMCFNLRVIYCLCARPWVLVLVRRSLNHQRIFHIFAIYVNQEEDSFWTVL